MNRPHHRRPSRRDVLAAAAVALPAAGYLQVVAIRPARAAAPETMDAAIREFAGEAAIREGRVKLEIPALVENGNSVTLTVAVESPMSAADHVKTIAVFNEKNPQPNVAVFHLGPRSGRARVETRIRLATSQKLIAVAQMSDGSLWQDSADVIVTLAACLED
jgi:sulfur-oxidizing protein SoxY